MTKEEFIQILKDDKGYSYKIERNKIIVTHDGGVDLDSLKSIPPGVKFKNGGYVYLDSLKTIPPGVEFNNGGDVYLNFLETLPPGVEFNNGGDVYLDSLKIIPPDVHFNNGDDVNLESLTGDWFSDWKGNIEGIDKKRLLNVMIKRGVFL